MPCPTWSYKGRHLIENAFMDTKQCRGIATRFATLVTMFEGQLQLVARVNGTSSRSRTWSHMDVRYTPTHCSFSQTSRAEYRYDRIARYMGTGATGS